MPSFSPVGPTGTAVASGRITTTSSSVVRADARVSRARARRGRTQQARRSKGRAAQLVPRSLGPYNALSRAFRANTPRGRSRVAGRISALRPPPTSVSHASSASSAEGGAAAAIAGAAAQAHASKHSAKAARTRHGCALRVCQSGAPGAGRSCRRRSIVLYTRVDQASRARAATAPSSCAAMACLCRCRAISQSRHAEEGD